MVFGVGINDLTCDVASYQCWHSMLRRGYSSVYKAAKPTYANTRVHADWHRLSTFHEWWLANAVTDWQLDKDLLGDGNMYSAEYCTFLPNEINTALQVDRDTNGLPPGVSYKSKNKKYVAQLSMNIDGKRLSKHLGLSTDPLVCFQYYKTAKEQYIKELAERHRSKLDTKAYSALMQFTVQH